MGAPERKFMDQRLLDRMNKEQNELREKTALYVDEIYRLIREFQFVNRRQASLVVISCNAMQDLIYYARDKMMPSCFTYSGRGDRSPIQKAFGVGLISSPDIEDNSIIVV